MRRRVIESMDDVITFGTHAGRSIKWIVENEPSYILWLVDETDIEISHDIVMKAQSAFDDETFGNRSEWV